MNQKRILQLTQEKASQAVIVAAHTASSLMTPLIPVYLGSLRRDRKIDLVAPGTVHIIQSPKGTDSHQYAKYQYGATEDPNSKPLRHRETGDGYASLTQGVPLGAGGRKQRGRGDKYLYGRAYRIAVKNNLLQKSRPEWFKKFLNTPSMVKEVITVAANRWRK